MELRISLQAISNDCGALRVVVFHLWRHDGNGYAYKRQ
jgi:hypothetical protein